MVIVLDTNVFISALRSRRGASFKLLSLVGTGRFDVAVSVPLALEYEGVANRLAPELGVSGDDITDILDYLCAVAIPRPVFFLLRPTLPDPIRSRHAARARPRPGPGRRALRQVRAARG